MTLGGAAAEARMLSDLAASLRPGARVLDAGSGTGALSRHIKSMCPEVELTMADLSSAMLEQAADVTASRVVADVQTLPFRAGTFDVVVSSWVIETVPEPARAVAEYLRVLTQEGRLFYTFCSRPVSTRGLLRTLPLRAIVRTCFAGHFLPKDQTAWHECASSHRFTFDEGLTTEIALSKCCAVDATWTPGLTMGHAQPRLWA